MDGTLDFGAMLRCRLAVASRRPTPPPTTRRSSSTPRARPGRRRARSTPTGSCSATCPASHLPHDFAPQPGDRFWTPADWAWIGGLYDVLFPAWHWGLPVVAHRARRFEPERALDADGAPRRPERVPAADRAQADPPLGRDAAPADLRLRSVAQRRRDARRRAARLGPRHVRADDQRVLRPDRVQPRRRQQRRADGRPAGLDGPAGAGPRRRRHRRRRRRGRRRASSARSRSARPDPVMFLGYWNQPEATRRQVRRRLAADGRSRQRRRGRLPLVPGPRRRRHHQRRATGSARARSRTACCATRRSPWPRSSASPTRSGRRRSRRSWSSCRAQPATRR